MYARVASAIKTVSIENSHEMVLKYFILKDIGKDVYGIEIEKYHMMADGNEQFMESDSVDNITNNSEKVTAFFEMLCDEYVTPMSLSSIVDDCCDYFFG